MVSEINHHEGTSIQFEVYPVIKQERDQRSNKRADYSILRVYNRITYIVIEIKLSVGAVITSGDSDNLAQLFLEVYYVYEEEKERRKHVNTTILCVLTDGITWHLIKINMQCKPLKFVVLITTKDQVVWDSNLKCDL